MKEKSTSSSEAHPASPSRTEVPRAGSPIREETSRSSLRGWLNGRMSAGWCGRTSRPCLPSTEDATSPPFSPSSPDGTCKRPPADGGTRGSSPARPDASAFRGECWTLDIPEFPHFRGRSRSEGAVWSLSDFVATGRAPQRRCLAASYAEALLRRAERRGYAMPSALEKTLRRIVSRLT